MPYSLVSPNHCFKEVDLIDVELDDQQAYFRFNELVDSVLLAHNIPIKSSILDISYDLADLGFSNVIKCIDACVCLMMNLLMMLTFLFAYAKLTFLLAFLVARLLLFSTYMGSLSRVLLPLDSPSLKILRLEHCIFLNA